MYDRILAKVNTEQITERFVAAIQAGSIPVSNPRWKGKCPGPYNAHSEQPYHGMNVLIFGLAQHFEGYKAQGWITYKQIEDMTGEPGYQYLLPKDADAGYQKGDQKTTMGVKMGVYIDKRHYKFISEDLFQNRKTGEMVSRSEAERSFYKPFHVFNLDQTTGLPEDIYPKEVDPVDLEDRSEAILRMVRRMVPVTYADQGQGCFYIPNKHQIMMELFANFASDTVHDITLLHEGIHATGHHTLLGRFAEIHTRPSEEDYAEEELIAEMGAAFAGAQYGLTHDLRHARYLQVYIEKMQADATILFRVSAAAQRASDHLMLFSDALYHSDDEQLYA